MHMRRLALSFLLACTTASVLLAQRPPGAPAGPPPDLSAEAREIERRLALVDARASLEASILYPFDLVRVVREGDRTMPGRGYDLDADLARSESLLTAIESGTDPLWRVTGDLERHHYFSAADEILPYRTYVPEDWDGEQALPIVLMLHGGGATEDTYMDHAGGLLPRLAERYDYIVVSPLGYRPTGAYGTPLRLPAVFGQPDAAETQRAAVTPERARELALSELEVMAVLEIVTSEYGADRARTYLAGHSMGSGGAWHLAARYPGRWRAVAPMSGPFVDEPTYSWDRIRALPILMTEGTGAEPSLEGSRQMAAWMSERDFDFEYVEVDGDHMGMVPMVWEQIFEFFETRR